MKYFMDTEFSARGRRHPIELISIGIVAEDGREFYRISNGFDWNRVNPWVHDNVLPLLEGHPDFTVPEIVAAVREFIGEDKPEFWGYYADYDWVVFCQMFGTMMDLPKGWPMYCRDIKQWCDQFGNPKLPAQSSTEHNALNDARWNKLAWDFLASMKEAA